MTTNYYKVRGSIYSASIKLVNGNLCVCTEREEPNFAEKNNLKSVDVEDFIDVEQLSLEDNEQTFNSLGSMIYLQNSVSDEFEISEKGKGKNEPISKVPEKSIYQYKYNKEQKPKLVIGTMNIIGDAYNPIEFEPYLSEEKDKTEYNKYKKQLEEIFNKITYGDIRDDLKEFDSLFPTDTEAKGEAKSLLDEPTKADNFFKKKEIGDKKDFLNKKLIELFKLKENGINLQEDNKWKSDKGRLNPLVYALAPYEDIIQKDIFNDNDEVKIKKYKNKLKEAYRKKLNDTKEGKKNLYLDLLLWDLFCCKLLQVNYKDHAGMCKYSYLCNDKGESVSKGDLFKKLFNPLLKLKKNNLQNDFIIGCQELPGNIDDINKIIRDNFTIEKHDKSTGFIMSEGIEFKNITEEAKGIFGDFVKYKNEKDEELKDAYETTRRKMFVGKFKLNNKKEVIVANFHCKSFKKNSEVQGELIKHILDELKKNYEEKEKEIEVEVFVVGDMNIEPQKKYKNGEEFINEYSKDDLKNKGKLPKENENLKKFNIGKGDTYTIFPKIEDGIGTITTLKQRTLFQGQPGKAGELNATQKDVVILPQKYDDAVVTLGGRPQEGIKDIMELLQPSREWPGDHFAIFTSFELKSTAGAEVVEPEAAVEPEPAAAAAV